MKKELKKYIKQNLVKETKKCYAIPSRRFCFINKIYRIIEVNELLDEYNCELFDY